KPGVIASVPVWAGQPVAMWAGLATPPGSAAQEPTVSLAVDMDRPERWRGQRSEDAGMAGNGLGDSLAAAQSRADELIGVRPVDLGTGRALGGAAGLARDRQDATGLVDGGVAVQQFAAGPVDVIDAATQQNRLQASPGVAGGAYGDGVGGQRVALLS